MSWIRENAQYTWAQRAAIAVLKKGALPRHVGFIMDGNRRFARQQSMEKLHGHLKGFDKLAETLEWCRDLGITEVTVYAFSIENFKRSEEEIDYLMQLSRDKFAKLLQQQDLLDKHGVCVRIIGNLDLLPPDIQQLAAEIILSTEHHTKCYLNVCMAYTSRDEITSAIRAVRDGVQAGLIQESDITESLLTRCTYMRASPGVDLLIRTSGEVRLSDFLMWQSSFACLSFVRAFWPEFSVWHLCAAVFHYQNNYAALKAAEEAYDARLRETEYQANLHLLPNGNSCNGSVHRRPSGDLVIEQRLDAVKEERIRHFLDDRERRYREKLIALRIGPVDIALG